MSTVFFPLSMQIAFSCPKCEAASCVEIHPGREEIDCAACHREMRVPSGALEAGRVNRCIVCPSTDLFVRKDFPQRLGVLIVTVGLLGSCVAWGFSQIYLTFAILFATALLDVVLYVVVPDALMCYRCGAMYRGAAAMEEHGSFDLETHERYRQQKIRLAEATRSTVGTPESTSQLT